MASVAARVRAPFWPLTTGAAWPRITSAKFFSHETVDTYAQAMACDSAAFNRFFHAMLERGVYLAPSAY